jgi:hypothetical protein
MTMELALTARSHLEPSAERLGRLPSDFVCRRDHIVQYRETPQFPAVG